MRPFVNGVNAKEIRWKEIKLTAVILPPVAMTLRQSALNWDVAATNAMVSSVALRTKIVEIPRNRNALRVRESADAGVGEAAACWWRFG